MKKTVSVILLAISILAFAGCASKSDTAVIGILQYADHASLDNCREGFIEGLKDSGLVEGVDFKTQYQNAGADDSKSTQIAQSFASKNVALMCAIATPAAQSCYSASEDNNIPVVFTAITDPQAAHLDSGNITGTSDKLPITAQLELIRKLQPNAKTIGIIYTSSEPNSVSAIEEYKANAAKYGFEIIDSSVTQQSQVTLAVNDLIAKGVDCFSNLTDNNVVAVLPSILEKTNDASIPVYGSEIEQVKLGCVASAGIDYFELGKKTGRIAARILRGENASDIKYETITDFKTYINSDALAEMNIKTDADFISECVEVG